MNAAISLLRELLKDKLGILKPSDHPQIESAIAILEAAGKVDKPEMMDWLDGQISTMPYVSPIVTKSVAEENRRNLKLLLDLLAAIPEEK
jgi:hypothetical protein